MNNDQEAEKLDAMRADFEAWWAVENAGEVPSRNDVGGYLDDDVDDSWKGWCAGIAAEKRKAADVIMVEAVAVVRYDNDGNQYLESCIGGDRLVEGEILLVSPELAKLTEDDGSVEVYLSVPSQLVAQRVSVPDGDMSETKWFVMTGNNEADTAIFLFSSRYFAEQYCANNPSSRGYRIYQATPVAPKREGE
jgi:hypothetical protein